MSSNFAEDHDIAVGDVLTLRSTADKAADVTVVGHLRAAALLPAARERQRLDRALRLALRPPAQPLDVGERARRADDENRAQMEEALAGFPDTQLETRQEWIDREDADFNEFIPFLYVMLTLAVFVSIFGMINTLVLSVYERTREIGMLRAIGMTRRQVRRMIRQESIITALIGAAIGLPLGIFLAALVNRRSSEYDVRFSIPWAQLVVLTIVAIDHRDPGRDHARTTRGQARIRSRPSRTNESVPITVRHPRPAQQEAAHGADGARDRPRRRDDQRHLRPHGLDLQAFDKIFTDIRQGSNAVITGKSAFDLSDGSGVTEPTFDESLLPKVRALPAVAQAEGSVDTDTTQFIGDDGKAVVFGGAPNLGFSIGNPDSPFNPLTLVEGEWPGPNEVMVDKDDGLQGGLRGRRDRSASRPRGRSRN